MAVGDIWRLAVEGDWGGNDLVNVFHYQTSVSIGPVSGEAQTLAESFWDTAGNAYLQPLVNTAQVLQIKVRGVTHPELGYDLAVGEVGGASPPVLPLQNGVLALMDTAKFGRSYRGRNWHPAISELAVENGAVGVGTIALINAFYEDAQSVGTLTYFFQLGVYSRTLNEFNVRTGTRVQPYIRIQRRRTPGVGS